MTPEEWEARKADFFVKLELLYLEFNVSIAHEDHHGAFIIEDYDIENVHWIKAAQFANEYE